MADEKNGGAPTGPASAGSHTPPGQDPVLKVQLYGEEQRAPEEQGEGSSIGSATRELSSSEQTVSAELEAAEEAESEAEQEADKKQTGGKRRTRNNSTVLFDLIIGKMKLWLGDDDEAYATFSQGDHWENWHVKSRRFRRFLVREFFASLGNAPGAQVINEAIELCETRAWDSGEVHRTNVRVGGLNGDLWIDLGDPAWRAVRVQPRRWTIERSAPIKFLRRSNEMKPLPLPERDDAKLEDLLKDLVNIKSEDDFKLFIGWLIAAFHPTGPYPILAVDGPQGSAKSTLSAFARNLVDPNGVPLRSAPLAETDLLLQAEFNHVVSLDNQSGVAPWLSDAFCRLAYGAGLSKRKLYEDKEETLYKATRPCILNGIPSFGSRGDFASRCVMLTLPRVGDGERRDDHELKALFAQREGKIFGALLDGLQWAVADIGDYEAVPRAQTRMTTFERWVEAAAPGLGWNRGEFIACYLRNLKTANAKVIEADVVAQAVISFIDGTEDGYWRDTPRDCLTRLEEIVREWPNGEAVLASKAWPRLNKLSDRLQRASEPLRRAGIEITLGEKSGGSRFYTIQRVSPAPPDDEQGRP